MEPCRAWLDWTAEGGCPYIFSYSYLKLSTGSSFAALAAGTVPKSIPTSDDVTIATIADSPEIGIRYSVKNLTEYGIASPITTPISPPINEISSASDKN